MLNPNYVKPDWMMLNQNYVKPDWMKLNLNYVKPDWTMLSLHVTAELFFSRKGGGVYFKTLSVNQTILRQYGAIWGGGGDSKMWR